MKELLIYALEVLVCSAALLLAYSVLLERRTAFLHCRLYLIGAMLLAALIPALSIPVWTGETLYMAADPVAAAAPTAALAAADAGTAKCFSCKDSFLISGLVLQPSSGRHEIYQFVNCFVLCGYRYIQSNAFLLQQFCNSHHLLPLFFIQLHEQFHNFFPAADSM